MGTETVTASAWQTPAYSYVRNYISDLGVAERVFYGGRVIYSPLHAVMNTGFVLHGLLFALAALFISVASLYQISSRLYLAFAVVHAIGMSLIGLIPENVSELHGLGALLAIGGGNLVIITGGMKNLKPITPSFVPTASLVLGIVGIVSFVFLLVSPTVFPGLISEVGGAIERCAVYTISAWDFLAGITLLDRKATAQKTVG